MMYLFLDIHNNLSLYLPPFLNALLNENINKKCNIRLENMMCNYSLKCEIKEIGLTSAPVTHIGWPLQTAHKPKPAKEYDSPPAQPRKEIFKNVPRATEKKE